MHEITASEYRLSGRYLFGVWDQSKKFTSNSENLKLNFSGLSATGIIRYHGLLLTESGFL